MMYFVLIVCMVYSKSFRNTYSCTEDQFYMYLYVFCKIHCIITYLCLSFVTIIDMKFEKHIVLKVTFPRINQGKEKALYCDLLQRLLFVSLLFLLSLK